jgi:hypothetical protein
MIQLPTELFLQCFPDRAALIGPDKKIIQMNPRLASELGSGVGRSCPEVLAGLPRCCPFCPFDDLIGGISDPVLDAVQVRWGQTCAMTVRSLAGEGKERVILKTIH